MDVVSARAIRGAELARGDLPRRVAHVSWHLVGGAQTVKGRERLLPHAAGVLSRLDGEDDVEEIDPLLLKRNKEANKYLEDAVRSSNGIYHLLLLGAGESGKSTVFKQMKVLNQGGYTKDELKGFRPIVHRNVLDGIQTLLRQCEQFELELDASNEERGDRVQLWEGENLNPQIGEDIALLWKDPAVLACYDRRDQFQFPTAAKYFLDECCRLAAKDYLPNLKDAVSLRLTHAPCHASHELTRAPPRS